MYIAMIILYYIVMCLFRIFRMNEYHNINLYQKIHPILLQWLLLTYHLSYQLCIIPGISEFYLSRVGNVPNKYLYRNLLILEKMRAIKTITKACATPWSDTHSLNPRFLYI
jgi:hypothetical protein